MRALPKAKNLRLHFLNVSEYMKLFGEKIV